MKVVYTSFNEKIEKLINPKTKFNNKNLVFENLLSDLNSNTHFELFDKLNKLSENKKIIYKQPKSEQNNSNLKLKPIDNTFNLNFEKDKQIKLPELLKNILNEKISNQEIFINKLKKEVKKNLNQKNSNFKNLIFILSNKGKKTNLIENFKHYKNLKNFIKKFSKPIDDKNNNIKFILQSMEKSTKIKNNKTQTTKVQLQNHHTIADLIDLTRKQKLNLKKLTVNDQNIVSIKELKEKILDQNKEKFIPLNEIKTINKKTKLKKSTVDINALITKNFSKHHKNKLAQKNDNIFLSEINTPLKQKIVSSKQSIKHFVSSLKEAIDNYKPPISKLSLELHPKELGKVEVVIKQHGENLNVQINTTNQTTINFLTSQQQELKNSLVNMGFTNINMNFNSNDQHKKQQKHHQFQNISKTTNEKDDFVIEFQYKYA